MPSEFFLHWEQCRHHLELVRHHLSVEFVTSTLLSHVTESNLTQLIGLAFDEWNKMTSADVSGSSGCIRENFMSLAIENVLEASFEKNFNQLKPQNLSQTLQYEYFWGFRFKPDILFQLTPAEPEVPKLSSSDDFNKSGSAGVDEKVAENEHEMKFKSAHASCDDDLQLDECKMKQILKSSGCSVFFSIENKRDCESFQSSRKCYFGQVCRFKIILIIKLMNSNSNFEL
jgi:hypothetical protein